MRSLILAVAAALAGFAGCGITLSGGSGEPVPDAGGTEAGPADAGIDAPLDTGDAAPDVNVPCVDGGVVAEGKCYYVVKAADAGYFSPFALAKAQCGGGRLAVNPPPTAMGPLGVFSTTPGFKFWFQAASLVGGDCTSNEDAGVCCLSNANGASFIANACPLEGFAFCQRQ